ncbi:MAG: TraI domain-containing protein [Bacteroidaceae bacterium]|nr:TraI domain-containing protein [Bacteroidaceae bacterium]
MNAKQYIERQLRAINRIGTEELLAYMDEHGFYTAPASRSFHHHYDGGLADHSIEVMLNAQQLKLAHPEWYEYLDDESIIIASLLHDLCKMELYAKQPDGTYKTRKRIAARGHGRLSNDLADKVGLDITGDERHAIRWHMGRFTSDLLRNEDIIDYKEALTHPLTYVIHVADSMSAKGE